MGGNAPAINPGLTFNQLRTKRKFSHGKKKKKIEKKHSLENEVIEIKIYALVSISNKMEY